MVNENFRRLFGNNRPAGPPADYGRSRPADREDYPDLKLEIKWNQPMFVMDGTFILAFSASKNHFSISPEEKGVKEFSDYMDEHDISYSKMLFRMPWDPEKIDYALIKQVIDFNMEDKEGYEKFWRWN